MTLTKNVLTRIIKEELAKIISEQRNPRRINEMLDPVLTPAVIAAIIKSLGSTAVVTKAMAIVTASLGGAMGGAAAASKHMTDRQTFDIDEEGEEGTMQEAKKKAASTGSAAKMGFGTKSKMASHKFSPLKTKK